MRSACSWTPTLFGAGLVLALPATLAAQQGSYINLSHRMFYTGKTTYSWNSSFTSPVTVGQSTVVGCFFDLEGFGTAGAGWSRPGTLVHLQPYKVAILLDGKPIHVADGPSPIKIWYPYGPTKPWTTKLTNDPPPKVETEWKPTKPGDHEIRCSLDLDDVIKESKESDNSGARQIAVVPPSTIARKSAPAAEKEASKAKELKPATGRPAVVERESGTPGSKSAGPLFKLPMWDGKRVDLCLLWGAECGEPAATEFCKLSGYGKAVAWKPAYDIGAEAPTLVLGANKVCSEPSCDGFDSITCGK